MIQIGITGGIGSGKSVVATLLQLYGIPVYLADNESKQLLAHSPRIRQQLTALFGPAIYTPEGINRQLLASRIFSNPQELERVNAIVHPVVNDDFLAWADRQNTQACAIESAILFESGFDRIVDVSLLIHAPIDLRIERALQRDSVPREEILRRISNQMSDEKKKERADYVICNDGCRALLPQVAKFISFIFLG